MWVLGNDRTAPCLCVSLSAAAMTKRQKCGLGELSEHQPVIVGIATAGTEAGPFGIRLGFTTMSEPLVRTAGLRKHYLAGDAIVHAVSGVSLSIQPGEFVAIVGRSGSGKSTLMSLLGLLERPETGKLC